MLTLTRKKQAVAAEEDPRHILDHWRAYHPEESRLFTVVLALREVVAKANTQMIFELGTLNAMNGPFSVANTIGDLVRYADSPHHFDAYTGSLGLHSFASFNELLRVAESSPEFIEAERQLLPLIAAVEKADAADQARRVAIQKAEQELNQTRARITEEAIAGVQNDPAVQGAKEALKQLKG